MKTPSEIGIEPWFIADHPVLDLMNTVAIVEGQKIDFLKSDADALRWLQCAGLAPDCGPSRFFKGTLVSALKALREIIRGMVEQRKLGKKLNDLPAFNRFLRAAASYPELIAHGTDIPVLGKRLIENEGPERVLSKVSEAAAELLSAGNFDLVRPCAGHDCILWFYDKTKSHRRRWCSMAVCGNRHKVASFRQRQNN